MHVLFQDSTQPPMPKAKFRVIHAGPWEPETFGIVEAEVLHTADGLEARLCEPCKGPMIRFRIDAYERHGDLVFFRTNATRKWILRALP